MGKLVAVLYFFLSSSFLYSSSTSPYSASYPTRVFLFLVLVLVVLVMVLPLLLALLVLLLRLAAFLFIVLALLLLLTMRIIYLTPTGYNNNAFCFQKMTSVSELSLLRLCH